MTRDDAKKLAIPHKDKSKVVHVTGDGNVFFEPQTSDAQFHARKAKVELFTFNSEKDLISTEEQKAQAKAEKEAKKAEEAAKAQAESDAKAKEEADAKSAEEAKAERPIEELKFGELVNYCRTKGYPEEEFSGFKKKDDILAYAQSKVAPTT